MGKSVKKNCEDSFIKSIYRSFISIFENGRKENTEKLKENESALVSSAEQTYSDETVKYLQNKNVIENEDAKVIGVREKEEAKSDENALAVESIVTKATDDYEINTLSDDEQRLNTRSEIEIINTNSAEYDKITNEKQEKNAAISEDKVQGLVNDYYTQQISVYQKEANTFKALRTPKLGLGYFGQTIDTKSYFQGFTAGLQIPLFGGANTAPAPFGSLSYFQVVAWCWYGLYWPL